MEGANITLTIRNLPQDVLRNVYIHLDPEDLIILKNTHSFFRNSLLQESLIWRDTLFAKWPYLKEVYGTKHRSDWLDQCLTIMNVRFDIRKKIMAMSSHYFWKTVEMSEKDLHKFDEEAKKNDGLAVHYIMHTLNEICDSDIVMAKNIPHDGINTLTNQYYAGLIYDHLYHRQLDNKENNMLGKDIVTPEMVLNFYEHWVSPRSKFPLLEKINNLVNDTIDKIYLFRCLPRDLEQLLREKIPQNDWKNSLLEDNEWSSEECQKIFMAVAGNMDIEFIQHIIDGMESKISSDKIFKIFFTIVVRRMGVRCDLIEPHQEIYIYWKPKWKQSNSTIYIIDAKTGDKRASRGCPYQANIAPQTEYVPVEFLQSIVEILHVIERYNNELVYDHDYRKTELMYYLEKDNFNYLCMLAKMGLAWSKDVSGIKQTIIDRWNEIIRYYGQERPQGHQMYNALMGDIEIKERMYASDETDRRKVKPRHPSVRYSIGSVCAHKYLHYQCVVLAWDIGCYPPPEWRSSINVDSLEQGPHQPFYHAMSNEGVLKYVAQEKLEIRNPRRLIEIEDRVGSNFSHFNGERYIPNKEKATQYPDPYYTPSEEGTKAKE